MLSIGNKKKSPGEFIGIWCEEALVRGTIFQRSNGARAR